MDFNKQYLSTIETVLTEGEYVAGRNSAVLQYFAPSPIVIKDVNKEFPILSVRKIPFYKAVLETFFFLSGNTSFESMPEVLRNTWWKPWAKEAESRDSWGKFYSYQWRNADTDNTTNNNYFDQWEYLINDLVQVVETGLVNRRMVVSLWKTQDFLPEFTSDPAVLPACHSTALIFNLVPKWHKDELESGYAKFQEYYLDLHHTQRSLDLFLGAGSDLIYSGLLMHLLCKEVENRLCGVYIKPRKLVFSPANTHIYESHIPQAKQLLTMNSNIRSYSSVKLKLQRPIVDFGSYKTIEDAKQVVTLAGYSPLGGNYKGELHG